MCSSLTLVLVLTAAVLTESISVGHNVRPNRQPIWPDSQPIRPNGQPVRPNGQPVRPGCGTNKIAPHRHLAADYRTLGYFYDLLVDDGGQADPDCGVADDDGNDDNDNEVGTGSTGKSGPSNRFFLNWFGHSGRPQNSASSNPPRPSSPVRPDPTQPPRPGRPPTRPPYHSGGLLAQGDRPHVPPRPEHPSDAVKPVYEHQPDDRPPAPWRPRLGTVGAPSAYVMSAQALGAIDRLGAQRLHAQSPRLQYGGGGGGASILGSFIDLFFK